MVISSYYISICIYNCINISRLNKAKNIHLYIARIIRHKYCCITLCLYIHKSKHNALGFSSYS